MDARLRRRIAEGRQTIQESRALDGQRGWEPELDAVRRSLANLIEAVETSPSVGYLRVGDVLEWVAGAAAAVGAYFATRLAWPALIVVAVFLIYQAQCYSLRIIPRRRK